MKFVAVFFFVSMSPKAGCSLFYRACQTAGASVSERTLVYVFFFKAVAAGGMYGRSFCLWATRCPSAHAKARAMDFVLFLSWTLLRLDRL